MNVLEQLQALGFREEPYQFYDGGDVGDPSGGAGEGPGGTDVGAEISVDYGGTGPSAGGPGLGPGGTELSSEISSTAGGTGRGTVSIAGPVSPESPEVLASYASGRLSNFDWGSPQGREAASILAQLDAMGYGRMEGVNAANPTQSVQELIASSNVAAAAPYALSFMPGYSMASTVQRGAQLISDISSGKLSPTDALADVALSFAASALGVSKGVAMAMASGDYGKAAADAAKGAVTNAIAQATGLPSGIVGMGIGALGTGLATAGGGAPAGGMDAAGGGADMTGGATDVASAGGGAAPSFDLGNLGPVFTLAALEDILTPQEQQEQQEQARATPASPFGSMPYA